MKDLDKVILEMTKDSEELTINWVFDAIEKTRTLSETMYEEVDAILKSKYSDRKERVYAHPSELKRFIDEKIGYEVYNIGKFYQQRGVRKGLREEIVLDDVAKDYKRKRESLKNKILKLANGEDISSISEINTSLDSSFECFATLSSGDLIKIYTIVAGGYNIQKFHFRGLAKRIKK